MDPIDALHKLIADIGDVDVFRTRLNEWKATRDTAVKAQADLVRTRKETEAAAAKTTADLVAAGKRSDDAAAELKASINVKNEQDKRLAAMQKDYEERELNLTRIEDQMRADRARLDDEIKRFAKQKADLDARVAAVARREAKLKEALS